METPNQFEIAGPVFKPSTQYLTSQGYPLGTTCWFFEVKINFCCEIICGDTIDSAWAAVVAHLHTEGGLPNVNARNCPRQLEINHQAIHECMNDLLEALRKAVAWGDAASTHILYRENINWRYLDEARATLAKNMITLKKYLERNPTETEEERHLAEFAGNIEKDNLELRRLGGKVAHYVKAARSGDSPLIQAALVESIDEAIKAWDDYLSNAIGEADAFAKIEKLERERDEARREAIRWQDAWMNETTLQEMGSTLMPWMHGWKKSQEDSQPTKQKLDLSNHEQSTQHHES